MTKAEIVEKIYEQVGFSKQESIQMVENLFEIMKECLEHSEKIKISGFGNFTVRSKRERVGRNPHTGQEIKITARKVLTFKPSQILKNAVNPESEAKADKGEPGTS